MDNDAITGIISHMNADHADAVLNYARHFAGVALGSTATLVGFDATGMDIDVVNNGETERVRVTFESPVHTPGQARKVLIAMAQSAREALANARN